MAVEAKRGCGYRKVGGKYLVSGKLMEPCHRLPVPLTVCPTCHGGIKQSRGWTWVGPELLEPGCKDTPGMSHYRPEHCPCCIVCSPSLIRSTFRDPLKAGRLDFGLLWIGEKFYPTPEDFWREASNQGVSRRISAVPHDFVVGETWVLMAHPKACSTETRDPKDGTSYTEKTPGIVTAFRPERIELIVRQSEMTPENVEKWAKQGLTPIPVPDGDPDHDPKGNGNGFEIMIEED